MFPKVKRQLTVKPLPDVNSDTMLRQKEGPYDAIVVGAGFSGLQMLHNLREAGFRTRLFEAGSGYGGTWFWNRYPGARTDCDSQVYQLAHECVWKNFKWSERFSGREELQNYFRFLVDKLNLAKDIQLNTRITAATFDEKWTEWRVRTEKGATVSARHLIFCTGSHVVPYQPAFEGLALFQGQVYHSSAWPETEVNLRDKRVAVIGTGATGVQIIQELGPDVSQLTVFQRTPNFALPMRQYTASEAAKWQSKKDLAEILAERFESDTGLYKQLDVLQADVKSRGVDEVREHFERTWEFGALSFWLHNYRDTFCDLEANMHVYEFWRDKTRARIQDPVRKEILAPMTPPHAFGAKRPCLEQRYYEVFNQPNVRIISLQESPILRIAPNGIVTEREGLLELDVIIMATGFDSVTGALLNMDIRNGAGRSLRDKWGQGTWTHLGLVTAGFPNMFFLYGPQSLSDSSNGPVTAEIQAAWITELLVHMRVEGQCRLEARPEAEARWRKEVQVLRDKLLSRTLDTCWHDGTNVPGKTKEPLIYTGGVTNYLRELQAEAKGGYAGFHFTESKTQNLPLPSEHDRIPYIISTTSCADSFHIYVKSENQTVTHKTTNKTQNSRFLTSL